MPMSQQPPSSFPAPTLTTLQALRSQAEQEEGFEEGPSAHDAGGSGRAQNFSGL
jgi:hypothetical protein